jgi:hypothetical protein
MSNLDARAEFVSQHDPSLYMFAVSTSVVSYIRGNVGRRGRRRHIVNRETCHRAQRRASAERADQLGQRGCVIRIAATNCSAVSVRCVRCGPVLLLVWREAGTARSPARDLLRRVDEG